MTSNAQQPLGVGGRDNKQTDKKKKTEDSPGNGKTNFSNHLFDKGLASRIYLKRGEEEEDKEKEGGGGREGGENEKWNRRRERRGRGRRGKEEEEESEGRKQEIRHPSVRHFIKEVF